MKQILTDPTQDPARGILDYLVRETVEDYPDEYRGHPLFGDPSIEFDQAWVERLRRRRGVALY